jgi:hypothetical protein
MKFKRLFLILGPIGCIFFIILFSQMFRIEPPTPSATGERLNFSELAANEMISVAREEEGSRGETFFREYRVLGGKNLQLQAFPASGSIAGEREKEVIVRPLSAADVRGLDESLAFFRKTSMFGCSALIKYTFAYFRADKKIGEEVFINNLPIAELNGYYRVKAENKESGGNILDELYNSYGLRAEDIEKIVTLEMLCLRPPN